MSGVAMNTIWPVCSERIPDQHIDSGKVARSITGKKRVSYSGVLRIVDSGVVIDAMRHHFGGVFGLIFDISV